MKVDRACRATALLGALTVAAVAPAGAWELTGTKTIALHTREGQAVPIGTVEFRPEGERMRFTLNLDYARFKDYFVSMRQFKCLDGAGEAQCHVPYPYRMPATVTSSDLVWLEHALLFLYNVPRDYGAKLANGLYYRMQITEEGIVGTPQAVDLALIGAPFSNPNVPPYGPDERSDIIPEQRWFTRMTIR